MFGALSHGQTVAFFGRLDFFFIAKKVSLLIVDGAPARRKDAPSS